MLRGRARRGGALVAAKLEIIGAYILRPFVTFVCPLKFDVFA